MVEFTKASIETIKKKDKGSSLGQTDESTKDTGLMVSRMGSELTRPIQARREWANGRMASASRGSEYFCYKLVINQLKNNEQALALRRKGLAKSWLRIVSEGYLVF